MKELGLYLLRKSFNRSDVFMKTGINKIQSRVGELYWIILVISIDL